MEEIYAGDYLIWQLQIKSPFRKDDKWQVGIGAKLLKSAQEARVDKFILLVGQREIDMPVPNEKTLRDKEKSGEVEMRPSLFKGKPAMKIYRFQLVSD